MFLLFSIASFFLSLCLYIFAAVAHWTAWCHRLFLLSSILIKCVMANHKNLANRLHSDLFFVRCCSVVYFPLISAFRWMYILFFMSSTIFRHNNNNVYGVAAVDASLASSNCYLIRNGPQIQHHKKINTKSPTIIIMGRYEKSHFTWRLSVKLSIVTFASNMPYNKNERQKERTCTHTLCVYKNVFICPILFKEIQSMPIAARSA